MGLAMIKNLQCINFVLVNLHILKEQMCEIKILLIYVSLNHKLHVQSLYTIISIICNLLKPKIFVQTNRMADLCN